MDNIWDYLHFDGSRFLSFHLNFPLSPLIKNGYLTKQMNKQKISSYFAVTSIFKLIFQHAETRRIELIIIIPPRICVEIISGTLRHIVIQKQNEE